MADLFTPSITKLLEFGVFDVLIFVISTAVFYAFFRKSKILGDSPVVNGAVALSIGFLIFIFRWVTGTSLVAPFSILFTQWTTVLLFLIFGFLAASMFYPDMMSWLPKVFHSRSVLSIMIALGITLLITSGLISTFWATASVPPKPGQISVPTDIIIVAASLIIFMVMIMIAASIGGG